MTDALFFRGTDFDIGSTSKPDHTLIAAIFKGVRRSYAPRNHDLDLAPR